MKVFLRNLIFLYFRQRAEQQPIERGAACPGQLPLTGASVSDDDDDDDDDDDEDDDDDDDDDDDVDDEDDDDDYDDGVERTPERISPLPRL